MKHQNIKKSLNGPIYTIFTPFKKTLEIDYRVWKNIWIFFIIQVLEYFMQCHTIRDILS